MAGANHQPADAFTPSFLSDVHAQVLDKTEAARAESPHARVRQQQLQAMAQLPSAFDVLRVIFGVRGSCLRPKDEVVAALREKSSSRGGISLADARMQVSAQGGMSKGALVATLLRRARGACMHGTSRPILDSRE